jgi:hypothetical protein
MRRLLFVVSVLSAAVFLHCSSSSTSPSAAPDGSTASMDAASSSNDAAITDAGSSGLIDAAGSEGASSDVVTFTVPAGGGSVTLSNGTQPYAFAFPADAAGKTFTLEWLSPASQNVAMKYVDIFRLGPSGSTFATPVQVRPSGPEASTSPPFAVLTDVLPTSQTGSAIYLTNGAYPVPHFSYVLIPGSPAALGCSGGGGIDECFALDGIGNEVAVPTAGMYAAYNNCILDELCEEIETVCCYDSMSTAHLVTQGLQWCNGGSFVQEFPAEGLTGCGVAGCTTVTGYVSGGTCFSSANCNGAHQGMRCDGQKCSCDGDAGTTFAQGAACSSAAALASVVSANCH